MIAIPGAISMIESSLWGVFDGIFVGKLLGDTAFAALNLAFPFVLLNFSLADLVGVGSAVNISILLGKKEERFANNYFSCANILILLPILWGLKLDGIWMNMPITSLAVTGMAIFFFVKIWKKIYR